MKKKEILFFILIAAAVLRLYGLSRGDTVSDEVFMAFRGLGMIDFDNAPAQTTPWQWWDQMTPSGQPGALSSGLPWWAHLSMHDHPWGVPLVQNLSMKAFGENNFGFRLPSALLGVASVYTLYRIGTLLYSEEAGLIAAAILAVTVNNVYVSRLGLQESYAIFAILLATLYFLKSLKEPKYLLWIGVIIGIGAEMKYTALVLPFLFLAYLALFRREYFKNRHLWYGVAAALLFFSPSILYNVEMYRATGHFDFQIAHILKNYPPEWKEAPGKEIGSLADRIRQFIPRLIDSNSWLFLLAYAASLLGFCVALVKNTKETLARHNVLILTTFFILLLLLFIGPSYRFLTMLTPFMALSAGIFVSSVFNSHYFENKFALFAITLFFIFEIFYSVNNQIIYYPIGPSPWMSSLIRYENYNWGYNELGDYLAKELNGRMPAVTFDVKYCFLAQLREQAIADGKAQGLDLYPVLIVYEGNFDGGAKLWVLDRLNVYHAWPIVDLQTYFDYLRQQGFDYVEKSGFKTVYFIESTNWVPPAELGILTQGSMTSIYNPRGDEVFKVYKTILP